MFILSLVLTLCYTECNTGMFEQPREPGWLWKEHTAFPIDLRALTIQCIWGHGLSPETQSLLTLQLLILSTQLSFQWPCGLFSFCFSFFFYYTYQFLLLILTGCTGKVVVRLHQCSTILPPQLDTQDFTQTGLTFAPAVVNSAFVFTNPKNSHIWRPACSLGWRWSWSQKVHN